MKRIDSVNARPNQNGQGKNGFSDNADISGMDATYVTPDFLNHIQEELANLLEKNGTALNPQSKQQLFDLLATDADVLALAQNIENLFLRKNQLVDNLTTDDSNRPLSAKQGKKLQDEKFAKTGGTVNGDMTVTGAITVNIDDAVGVFKKLIEASTTTDGGYLAIGNNGEDKGYVELGAIDDADSKVFARKRDGANQILSEVTLLGSNNESVFPVSVKSPKFIGELQGNASTATKLQSPRKINNIDFDGTSNITIYDASKFEATGVTGSVVDVAWNAKSGVYKKNLPESSQMIVHFLGDGSAPALQFLCSYSNGGLYYRSARDSFGFEKNFERIMTEKGGRFTGDVDFSQNITVDGGVSINSNILVGGTILVKVNDSVGVFKKLIEASTATDGGYLAVGNNGEDKGYVEIGTTDDAETWIFATQRGSNGNVLRRVVLLDSVGDTSFPGSITTPNDISSKNVRASSDFIAGGWVYADKYVSKSGGSAAFQGNADTASKLQNSRNIALSGAVSGNANFDGSGNINIETTHNNSVRAFINFNMSNGSIRKSSGISSVTSLGSGVYRINLSQAAPDANYAVVGMASWRGSAGAAVNMWDDSNNLPSQWSFCINCSWGGDNTAGTYNPTYVNLAIMY
ncbi:MULTISPECIES: hypothetical protein [Acinetobacter]|uniref:Phage tail fiber protein n=1 Tax=Acinetobacter ursingii TaxID=108980 RepID=A0A7T9ULF4_9GAMM|nr:MULTISPECIES: hypothetical protein [Acinetobacter]ENX48753.1 hypothetical protein F943_02290 [Acinetobacter ursingii NIPH 706]EXD37893.1 hypothetical protein J500_0354 [Acinetobacter sp. 479375]MCH2014711.1 hypothetical protein [Acinetobacter ursingii]MCU4522579.1 hypothetical protein [Acinetobacter ursingii]MCU4587400.1 hypothetical protein [Acinetobacter ursingii]